MTGNTISEFINDLYAYGDPEKEFHFVERDIFLKPPWLKELICLNCMLLNSRRMQIM